MTPKRPESDWTLDLSRYVDKELDPEAAAQLETRLQGAPDRARLVTAWRDAMDLWRDDVRQKAGSLPEQVIANRVARRLVESPGLSAEVAASRGAQRLAVAALVLLGLGLVGSVLLGSKPERANWPGDVPDVIQAVQDDRFALEGDIEVHQFCAEVPRRITKEDR